MYAKHGFVACSLRILRQESMFHTFPTPIFAFSAWLKCKSAGHRSILTDSGSTSGKQKVSRMTIMGTHLSGGQKKRTWWRNVFVTMLLWVGLSGFEPELRRPKCLVLPLHHSPILSQFICVNCECKDRAFLSIPQVLCSIFTLR